MKHYLEFARKQLSSQKVSSLLILIAVIISMVTTTVIGQSIGILMEMREEQVIALSGKKHGTFTQISKEQLDGLKSDKRLSYVGSMISLGNVTLNSQLMLELIEYTDDSLSAYPSNSKIVEGCLPEKEGEIALSEDVLQLLGFNGKTGDTVTLDISKRMKHGIAEPMDYTAAFVLSGIIEGNYIGYTNGRISAIVGEGTAREVLPEEYLYYNVDFCVADEKHFQETMDALMEEYQIRENDVSYNEMYLSVRGIELNGAESSDASGSGNTLLICAGILVGGLILLAAGLAIYNILKITVIKQIREYGILRAMGSEKRQLYQIVCLQILILCAAGIPIGILSGYAITEGILTMAAGFLSPEVFMAQSTPELNKLISSNSSGNVFGLIISTAVTVFFAWCAVIPSARYAANVSPVTALAERNIQVNRDDRKIRKIRNFEAYYARLNLKRNGKRTAVTITSLVMSISVFIALQGFDSLLDASESIEKNYLGDYSIVNETTGFSESDLMNISQNDEVDSVAAIAISKYYQNEEGKLCTDEERKVPGLETGFALKPVETFQVVGLNDAYWEHVTGGKLSDEEMELLKSGKACAVRNAVPVSIDGKELERTIFKEGDTICVEGKEYPVISLLEMYDGYFTIGNGGLTFGVQMIVSESLYEELTGQSIYNEICPLLKEGVERETFDSVVSEFCKEVPGTTYVSYEKLDQQLADSFEQMRVLIWILILFISLIGLLNIVNTVYTNIYTRTTEIGVQRALGMSKKALYKIFLWESGYYGMTASVIGSIIGYICSIFVEGAIYGAMKLVFIPFVPIIQASLVSVGTCMIAACIPLRKIAGMNIVENMTVRE